MTVKELIAETIRLAGMTELADSYETVAPSDEAKALSRTLLHCMNAVLDELARKWFPLKATQEFVYDESGTSFENFQKKPVRIVKVTDGEKRVGWRIFGGKLYFNAEKATVEYEYSPKELNDGDEFAFDEPCVDTATVQYGMLSEYYLICGETGLATVWENKYRHSVDCLLSRRKTVGRAPCRRWV